VTSLFGRGNLTLGSIDDSNDDEDMKNASAAILMISNNVKALRTARFELAERQMLFIFISPLSPSLFTYPFGLWCANMDVFIMFIETARRIPKIPTKNLPKQSKSEKAELT
jgi:hypothetical protein